MKNLAYLGMMLLVGFLFTGCGFVNNISYQPQYTESEIKDVSKINDTVVVAKSAYKQIHNVRRLSSLTAEIETNTDSVLIENISKDFLSQYFKNVEVSDSKDGLFIFNIDILELKPLALRNAPSFGVDFTVTVTQKGKTVLSKKYSGITKSPTLIDSDIWFDMEKVNLVYRAEGIHKGIFKILEKEVLPDLLKALKENS
jgi:hypothetical protein